MKVVVAGGRDYVFDSVAEKWLINLLTTLKTTHVLSGCQRGADKEGEKVANKLGLTVERYPAYWRMYGHKAGPIRNKAMAQACDAVVLFPGGKGTRSMERYANLYSKQVYKYG